MKRSQTRGVQGRPSGQKITLGIGQGQGGKAVQGGSRRSTASKPSSAKQHGLAERGFELRASVGKVRSSMLRLPEFQIESR